MWLRLFRFPLTKNTRAQCNSPLWKPPLSWCILGYSKWRREQASEHCDFWDLSNRPLLNHTAVWGTIHFPSIQLNYPALSNHVTDFFNFQMYMVCFSSKMVVRWMHTLRFHLSTASARRCCQGVSRQNQVYCRWNIKTYTYGSCWLEWATQGDDNLCKQSQ